MQYIHPIVLCGFMGCGKSVIGRLTAEKLGFDFADTDDMLLARTGMTLQQMFALGGEPYFREREYETVCAAAQLQRTVISTGGGVMTFPRNVQAFGERAKIVYIHRDFDACYAAITKRKNRPLAGQKSREELRALYDARLSAYRACADFEIENDASPEEAAQRIIDWYLLDKKPRVLK